jgi:uracil-DNA glycosylase family 4
MSGDWPQERRRGDNLQFVRDIEHTFELQGNPQVPGTGPDHPEYELAIVGEAPGQNEEEQQLPFVGKAGKLLTWGMSEAGFYAPNIYKTNVIDRRPPQNDIKSKEALQAMKVQKEEFWNEMRWLKSKGVRVVLAMGNTAMKAFGIEGQVGKNRGSIYEISLNWEGVCTDPQMEAYDFLVIPTWHPAAMLYGKRYSARGDMKADQTTQWVMDMIKAKEILRDGYERPVERFTLSPSLDTALETLSEIAERGDTVAVDIETAGFTPGYERIVCIGIAWSSKEGICIPFYRTGSRSYGRAKRYWDQESERVVLAAVERVLTGNPCIYQNATFDIDFLVKSGVRCNLTPAGDTMLMHHALDPEQPHNLGYIVSIFGATPYWKEEFSQRVQSIFELDMDMLQTYNLRDCVVLHQVTPKMEERLKAEGLMEAYREELAMVKPIIKMQVNGVKFHKTRHKAWVKEKEDASKILEEELRKKGKLPPAFNLDSADHLRLFLFGQTTKAMVEAAGWETHREGTKVREEKKELHEMVTSVRPMVEMAYRGRTTGTGKPSMDKAGLIGIRIYLENRIHSLDGRKRNLDLVSREQGSLRDLREWIGLLQEYRSLRTLLKSFGDGKYNPGKDGRIHPRYKMHGTSTSRLSCSDPNLQQVPKKDKDLRKCFVASRGSVLMSFDYSNLEFRVMAHECQDPKMIEILDKGLNQHDENTKALFGYTEAPSEDDPLRRTWDLQRRAAKIFQFGTQYGGGEKTVYENILLELPTISLTFADFKKARDNYFRHYHVYSEWADRQRTEAVRTRTVTNAFGRKRTLYGGEYDIQKQALNFPCQSGAAHIINMATVRIAEKMEEAGVASRLILQVHDQLMFEVPKNEVDTMYHLVRPEMEAPIDYRGQQVVFPVDVEVGDDWGSLQSYE